MSGMVGLAHFDKGMITTLGGVLVEVAEDGGKRNHYAIEVDGVVGPDRFGGRVPVFFVVGNTPYTPKFYPCVVIRRTDLQPAFENGGAWYAIDYRKRAKGSPEVTVTLRAGTETEEVLTGYKAYETKERATPYNISYDVLLKARGDRAMSDSVNLHAAIMRVCLPPGFAMTLQDTLGDDRGYDVIVQGMTPNLEALDLTDRDTGWSLSLVVHGELDHQLPFDAVSLYTEPVTTTTPVVP